MLKANWTGIAVICGGLGALIVGESLAQQPAQQEQERQRLLQQQQQQQAGRQAGQQEKQLCMTSHFKDAKIKDSQGHEAGTVKDLVISTDGKIEYLAVSLQEGSAGQERERPGQPQERERSQQQQAASGDKLTLIPWDVAHVKREGSAKQAHITVSLEKSQLQQAPSFTEQQLMSETQQEQLTAQVERFFSGHRRGAARPGFQQQQQQQQQREQQQREQREQRDN